MRLEDRTLQPLQVFVYGTLKPGEINFAAYCQSRGCEATPAMVFGRLYSLPLGYPAITAGDLPVYGFLLSFPDATALAELDQLEDYDPTRPSEQNEYLREQTDVLLLDRTRVGSAWIYRMSPGRIQALGGIWLPQGDWSSAIQAQYWHPRGLDAGTGIISQESYRISESDR